MSAHTAHFDDCGCKSARLMAGIAGVNLRAKRAKAAHEREVRRLWTLINAAEAVVDEANAKYRAAVEGAQTERDRAIRAESALDAAWGLYAPASVHDQGEWVDYLIAQRREQLSMHQDEKP